MSRYAVTPETHDAWKHLEINKELRTYERDREAVSRGVAELGLLYADLEKSPTAENFENYFKLGFELQCFAQRAVARTLERDRCRNICIADLEARPGAYPNLGTEEEVRRYVAEARRQDVKVAQSMAEFKEGQCHDAEYEDRLAALNNYIAMRHAREQKSEREPDNDESEPDIFDE